MCEAEIGACCCILWAVPCRHLHGFEGHGCAVLAVHAGQQVVVGEGQVGCVPVQGWQQAKGGATHRQSRQQGATVSTTLQGPRRVQRLRARRCARQGVTVRQRGCRQEFTNPRLLHGSGLVDNHA